MLANWAFCGISWFYALFTCIWLQYQTANTEHLGLFILFIPSNRMSVIHITAAVRTLLLFARIYPVTALFMLTHTDTQL